MVHGPRRRTARALARLARGPGCARAARHRRNGHRMAGRALPRARPRRARISMPSSSNHWRRTRRSAIQQLRRSRTTSCAICAASPYTRAEAIEGFLVSIFQQNSRDQPDPLQANWRYGNLERLEKRRRRSMNSGHWATDRNCARCMHRHGSSSLQLKARADPVTTRVLRGGTRPTCWT